MTVSEGNNINNINQNEDVFLFPASYGQKRMWFLDQFEPGSPYYNIPVAFKIKGRFEKDIFIKTINIIVSRHESIRTTFTNIKGQPFQVISPEVKLDIPVIDFSKKDKSTVDDEVKRIAVKEARAPFDLSKGPLFRAKIVKLSEAENVVLITMHHIISDGWSMGILVGEITSIYTSLLDGKQINLPELQIQYADFSEWQNEYLSGEVLEKQLNYWINKLGNSNSLLELPTDRNRQAVWTNNGSSIERFIPSEIIEELQKISNAENATLFMTLVAAFNILLYRYTGQDDINIGTPIANRTDKEIEKIIGLFINTLVLRTDLSGNPTFKELLSRVRKTNLEAFEHQDLPFEMLVDAIQPERNMSYAPLFQVMMILQNNPVNTTKLSDIEVSMLSVDMGTATSDITFSISTGTDGASCSIEYNTDLFDQSTIERMFNSFNIILKQIANNPNKKVSDYEILDDLSKNKILVEWNSRTIDIPKNNGIHSLFENWAKKTPNSIAVVDNIGRITYQELNNRANQLAHYLIENNTNRNLPVGISLNKSINLLVSVLGVLKSGFAYLPLDPTYPEERLNYMIEDSEIELLITDKNNSDIFSSFNENKIVIENIIEGNDLSKDNPNVKISEKDLAYIIYTSGSTGKAKGTMVQHNSLINIYLGWEHDYELLNVARNHLQMASFSFDVFGGDWTRALCSGGKLVIVAREQLLEAEQLYNIIINENIDIAEFVPAVLRNLISYIDEKSFKLDTFKVLIAGSDIWYVKEYNEFRKYCSPKTRLINSFGLTEAAIDSTFFEDNNLTLSEERLVPIGKPFPNIKIYILDNNLNTTPIGVKGELYIAGVSLARGYYKRSHLTAERFIPNPYSDKPGERLYRTGDLAKYLSDGNIEFLGRADNQIKLRGFRIELGEIENALSAHDDLKDAIVIVREDNEGDKRLVAYIIAENDTTIDINNLREFVSERVPDYMVPSAFVILEEFPLTPNGKVDRKSLPVPDQKEIQKSFESDYIAPRNKTEETIAKIWMEILSIDKVGVLHNFFILGGHSLLATQVISRIKSELKVDIPLRFIFEKPTVEALANEVEKRRLTSSELTGTKILPRQRNTDIPLSFAQERLWFLDQLEPNSPFYNIPESYRIKGEINLSILEKCFNKIIERHEILRTYFISEDGTPYQVIKDSLKINIPVIDLTSKIEEKRESEALRIIKEESKTPIPIEELPLFRIKFIKIDRDEHIFVMTIHHIISDDWSTRVIVRELGIIYESLIRNINIPLQKLPIQYADFSIWQKEWLRDKILASHIDYWKKQLADLPSLLELPTDFPRPKLQTYNGDFISFEFSPDVSKKINLISKEEGVTVFMMLLAAFKILLYKLSGQNDICIGTPSANRNKEEIEPLIGFFVNTLAIRTDCSNNPSLKEFIKRIKESTLGAYSHQDLPFEYIVDVVNPERNLSHSPIFQVMFVYQNAQGKDEEADSNLIIEPVESHSRTSKFDLTLFTVESNNSIGGAFEYNTDLFSKSTIESFVNYFKQIISNILENTSKRIENISLLDKEIQLELVSRLNSTRQMSLIKNSVPVEFTSIAEVNKNKIAIEHYDKQYSFKQLEEESNKLANYLISLGVTNEQIIGVCLDRSFNLIVTLLGILKAGAAYLPIDPNYPVDRIDYILQDSGTDFIITDDNFKILFDSNNINIININIASKDIQNEKSQPPVINISKNNICYVIYTSGSTGKPKGTLITHEGLQNYLSWTHHAYPFNQENGSLVHSTVAFDATVTSIFPSLLFGKKIVLMKESEELDELANVIKNNNKFSIIKITPAHLELLSDLISNDRAKDVSDAMIIGGENLTSNQIGYWQTHAPETLLFNEYGPTETVVGCIVYESSKYKGKGSVPIGKVIPNMKIYVLDKDLNQVPNGIIGELYLGGISLARGYLNKPGLTAEKFIPNPFAISEGERIYKTGDLVKVLRDGNLIFIGRVDDQVKVRGYRIELGEIEYQLNKISSINECVVDIKDIGNNDKRIIAYIIQDENRIEISEIFNLLKKELTEYMLPAHIIEIDKIPLTINGKVDRKKLPMPIEGLRNKDVEYVEPGTETEKKIFDIWSEILKINKISVYDNFFDLGGHSLLVTKLVVRIEQQFNITLPIRDIFEFPTIAQIASEIDSGKYSLRHSKLAPIKKYHGKNNIPLSFTQRRLWFLDKLDPGQSIYNMPMAMKINGKLNLAILEKTIDYLAGRHETLRTNFIEKNGLPLQVINDNHKIRIKVNDFTKFNDDDQKVKVNNIKHEEALQPFNLKEDALIRIQVAILSDEQFVIFFTMHHIISDGWSINILLEEFIQAYLSLSKNIEPDLPELQIQYSDFSLWQQENIAGEILDSQINYWVQKLENQPALLELPLDKKRPPQKTFNGSHLSFNINKSTAAKVDELLQSLSITPFMFLLGTFQILLSKLSGQNDISVGTTIANRTQIETEKIIGFFANTLVMRNQINGNDTIKNFFQQVKNTALESYNNQDVPFEKLVEILKPERDLSHTPLFQVMFVLQNNQSLKGVESDVYVEPLESESTSTQYDLTLSMNTNNNSLSGTLEFNTDLFEEDTISEIISSYEKLLNELTGKKKVYIRDLEYLSAQKKKAILNNSKGKRAEYLFGNVIEKFEAIVKNHPGSIACEFDNKKLSFEELDKKSDFVCSYLIENGYKTEDIIGVMIPSSIELVEWIIGIMKAGCVYMPIDRDYPKERIEYMLNDSAVKAIVINHDKNIETGDIKKIISENIVNEIDDNKHVYGKREISSENLAYLIYTSGSTGKPKGVMLRHEGLINLVENQIKDFYVTSKSKVLQFASISFDASISEMFMALLSGATLVLADRKLLKNTEEVKKLLVEHNISVVTLPPSLLQIMDTNDLTNTETIILAGEKLNKDVASKWNSNMHLINAYGPTEATVGVSCFEVNKINENWDSIPIGSASNNIELFILDSDMNPVKNGTVGEIYIGGIGLARGYISKPDLTAERFVPNIHSEKGGERLYRTGDLAKFTSNGVIEYVGRIDDQVKVRGFRIELTEIEIVLKSLPSVREAVVIIKGEKDKARLIGFIKSENSKDFNPEIIKSAISKKLPDYMVPGVILELEEVPLTPNGKIDRTKLQNSEKIEFISSKDYVAPKTNIETRIVEIWQELLNIKKIGITDNFFNIGGHSLLASQLISRLQDEFEIELPIRKLFELPTIQELSLEVEILKTQNKKTILPLLPTEQVEDIPLSFAQQRLWFLDQLEPENSFYNLPSAIKIIGTLNITSLQKSIDLVVSRHEILRTTFIKKKGKAFQNISNSLQINIQKIDLSIIKNSDIDTKVKEYLSKEFLSPFNLEKGPLLRAYVISLSKNENIFALTMHHIISDGWSMSILVNEIIHFYNSFENNSPPQLDELPVQYRDYSIWQRNWLKGEVLNKHIEYWKNQLKGVPALINLPYDRPRPPVQTFNGNTISFKLSKETVNELNDFSKQQNVTLFMTLLSAFQVLLNRYSGQEDIVVGTPIANRNNTKIEKLIGFFVNTLALKSTIDSNLSFKEILKRVKNTVLGAYSHQDLPFETLVDSLKLKRDMSYTPVFQVMFTLQNLPQGEIKTTDLKLEPIDADTNIAKFDLSLSLMEGNDGIDGLFEYNTDLFDEKTIIRMLKHFELLIHRMIYDSELPLSQIPLLSEEEKKNMISLSNTNFGDYSDNLCIHHYFEEQVKQNPNKVALVFEGEKLTYNELNKKANQLAHFISKTKVNPDDLIGLSLERSMDMVISIIAILKTGAAYVPIDPNYPEKRINFILNDANPKIFITQSNLGIFAPNKNCKTINIDEIQNEIIAENEDNLSTRVTEENIAYIIYTSGSTGNPKGVMVTHGNVARLFKSTNVDYNFNSNDIWTFFHSFAFDFSVWELWGALFYGAKVVIVPYIISRNTYQFYELLKREKVTILSQTPSAFVQLIKVDETFDVEQKLELKKVVFGGDKLDLQSLQPWLNKYDEDKPQLINMYGITETTVHVTYRKLLKSDLTYATGSLIGKPLKDLKIYILNEMLEPVPIGVPGEIYVSGAGLTRGYRNLPELTAEKFIPNPFSDNPGKRMYKTGDLARFSNNGDIEYLSRVDNQVQIYGFRVELGEIENAISEHPNIQQAVVILKGENETKRIVAYIIQNQNSDKLTTTELRKYLENKIPEYMLPSAYINMEEFPLTEHGKINYKILPDPGPERPELESKFVEATTEDEIKLENIWKQLLNIEVIGINDSFFDLGGDSILSIQMIALAKAAGLNLTPRQVFQNPTIKELAVLGKEGEDITSSEQGNIAGEFPLTPIQKWFFEHHKNSYNRFNTSMFLELFTKIDLDNLNKVFSLLAMHHDILRLELSKKNGEWSQKILPKLDNISISKIDLSKVKNRKLKDAINTEVENIQSSFDINKAPLFKIAYFYLGEHRNDQLLLVFHHLICDGVSWRILMNDIVSLFSKVNKKEKVILPLKSTSYKKWAEEIYRYAQKEELKEEINYWGNIQISDIAKLPIDNMEGENTYGSTESYTISLEKELTEKIIKKIPANFNAKLFDILITVLIRSLGKSKYNKYLIELEGHGREDIISNIDLSRTVGWFTSIYPIQIDFTNTKNIKEQIKVVNKTLKSIPNNGIGYSLLKYLSKNEKIKSIFKDLPNPELNFNFLGQFDQIASEDNVPFNISPYSMGMEQDPKAKRANLLYVVAVINGGMLHIRWLYSKNIHKHKTIKNFAKNFIIELKNILKDY